MINTKTEIIETAYGTAWKENGRLFVQFYSSSIQNPVYDITHTDLTAVLGYLLTNLTICQVLGSWGPSQKLEQLLASA